MRIDSEQLAQHLKGGLRPLYTVHGDEPLLALEAADRIRAAARGAGHAVREIISVEAGFDWGSLAVSGSSLSLFGDRRLLDVRIPSGKPGVEGGAALEAYCANLPPDAVTLVNLPGLEKAALNSGWFGALDRAGVTVAANAVPRAALPQWISARLAAQGQQVDDATLQFLADQVEGNLLAAWQEIQKLALLFPAGRLAPEPVREAVLDVARYDVFQLGDALLAGDAVRYARVLEGLRGEGVAAPLVLWSIAEPIRALARILRGQAAGRALRDLLREARVWGPRQDLVQRALKRVSLKEAEAALARAAEIDKAVKGLKSADVWDEMLELGLRLQRATAARRSASR